jgi:chaperonin cofactor prefoldin
MKKIKVLDLMTKRHAISRMRAAEVLNKLDNELENCRRITDELNELAHEKSCTTEVSTSYLFQAERYLVMKLMAQKEILLNRQDYLSDEISSASKNVSAIQSKIDLINELKLQKLGELKAKQQDFEEQELQTMKKR